MNILVYVYQTTIYNSREWKVFTYFQVASMEHSLFWNTRTDCHSIVFVFSEIEVSCLIMILTSTHIEAFLLRLHAFIECYFAIVCICIFIEMSTFLFVTLEHDLFSCQNLFNSQKSVLFKFSIEQILFYIKFTNKIIFKSVSFNSQEFM